MNSDLISGLDYFEREKGIRREVLVEAVQNALLSASKKAIGPARELRIDINAKTGEIRALANLIVVETVANPHDEITLNKARLIKRDVQLGEAVEVEVTPRNFGRIAAQTAKQVVVQRIREAERGVIYDEFIEKENEILTALVQRIEGKQVMVELGRTEGVLEPNQQMPGEVLGINDRIKVYVLEVNKTNRGPQVTVSRTHQGLVKRLFEIEVPEIQAGVVQIKSVAREAGSRTKMAVYSTDMMVDAVGSCVGPRGTRVENVVSELRNEKIDIVKWSPDPAEYIANALNPARVVSVFVSDRDKAARVIVPDNQLSLAIGKEGQNARLAAKLTGWKIDIKSQSQAEEMLDMSEEALPADEDEGEES